MHSMKHNVDTIKLQIMFWILIFLYIYRERYQTIASFNKEFLKQKKSWLVVDTLIKGRSGGGGLGNAAI